MCRKSRSALRRDGYDTAAVVVHGVTVSEPVQSSSLSVSKAFASNQALKFLQDDEHEHSLQRLCNCTRNDANSHSLGVVVAVDEPSAYSGVPSPPETANLETNGVVSQNAAPSSQATSTFTGVPPIELDDDSQDVDDGTEAGFAELARTKLQEEDGLVECDPKHETNSDAASEPDLDDPDLRLGFEEGIDMDTTEDVNYKRCAL